MIIGVIQSNHSTCIILHCSTQDTNYLELESYEEVMGNENKMKWVNAMQDEMKSLYENKWVYRVKQEKHTSQPRYKARLVVKVVSEHSRIDKLKKQLNKSFSMKDLGPAKKIFGIRLTTSNPGYLTVVGRNLVT